METEKIINFMAGLLVVSLIFSVFYYAAHTDNLNAKKNLKVQQSIVESVHGQGKVVEIYGYRVGTKEANYRYPIKCVVEADDGTRILININGATPVVGDVWGVCMKGGQASLCNLIKSGTKR